MNTYVETFVLRSSQCDMYGAWKPSAILECMQESAGVHSALFGLDRAAMNGMGIAWVLSRVKVHMDRVPLVGESITVGTYPTPNRHLFFPRTHIFRDEAGSQIGCANSLWVLMEIETRKITRHEEVLARVPNDPSLKSPLGLPATVRAHGCDGVTSPLLPAFTDYDTNHHVNNTKYLDWCLNALGLEVLESRCIADFDVNYDAEILPGTQVETELRLDGDAFTFFGRTGDKQHFAVGGTLCSRS